MLIKPRPEIEYLRPFLPDLPDKTVAELREILGLPRVIKLSFNENPLGPSPFARQAVRQALARMNLYHDPVSVQLRWALAQQNGVTVEEVLVGNGADDVISIIAQTFFRPGDEVVIPDPTFGSYRSSTLLMGATPVLVPLPDFAINPAKLLAAIGPKTRAVFLCHPNNPTGTYLPAEALQRFLAALPEEVLAIVDEAYIDYATAPDYSSALAFRFTHRALLVVRTFSKIHGLAAARVGYVIGPEELIELLNRVRLPFNLNYLGQVAALAALGDSEHQARGRLINEKGKAILYRGLQQLGLRFWPTQTNFLWVHTGRDSLELTLRLAQRGIIVRPGATFRQPEYLRLTIGLPGQNRLLLKALKEVLSHPSERL